MMMNQNMIAYRLSSDTNELTLKRLQEIVDTIPQKLRSFTEAEFSAKPDPEKWSKKEIIGHLIDSATNNHHRFVRAQFEDKPTILYDQLNWNHHSNYQQMDGHHLISFWEMYNRHLIHLVERIPQNMLEKECRMSDDLDYSIAWLFDDYVRHLEHHLRQVFT